MKSVLVVGAGAAGLIAGAFAARNGARTEIIERNEKAGKKLFLTGADAISRIQPIRTNS